MKRDKQWEEEYMPAFRAYYKNNGHPNAPRSHSDVGELLHDIRRGDTKVPPHFEEEIRSMGLFLCCSNLARHVMRVLRRAVVSLDEADVKRVVAEAETAHSRLLTL